MRRCSFLLIVPLTFLFSVQVSAQEFKVPKDIKFESQDDFTKCEPIIVKCADYLESAPLNADLDNRKEANAFFLRWLTGTAHVNITVQPYVTDLAQENKDFLMVYLSGWSRFVLQHPENKAEINCHIAAVQSVLKAYKQCAGATKDDAIDELIALDKEGTLQEWIDSKVQHK